MIIFNKDISTHRINERQIYRGWYHYRSWLSFIHLTARVYRKVCQIALRITET